MDYPLAGVRLRNRRLALLGATAPSSRRVGSRPQGALSALPPGFSESVVWSGPNQPIAVRFAPDGRIFVAEKTGVIKVFSG